MCAMDTGLRQLSEVMDTADAKLRRGESAAGRAWATGFDPLDAYLSGGVRSGELVLVGGPQGFGKTTFVLQALRNIVAGGGQGVYFSYEHDEYTVLERLLALEAGLLFGAEAVGMRRFRAALEAVDGRTDESLEARLADAAGGREAVQAVRGYAPRLFFARANGATTDLNEISGRIEQIMTTSGGSPVVVVDYLQKVPVPGSGLPEMERVTLVVEALKDLALAAAVPVVAVVAADSEGLTAGRRTRIQHLRGAGALAYEADVVLLLNDKFNVVARDYLLHDVRGAERFHDWAVVSVEKNRSGLDRIDLQFRKQFEHGRFDPEGSMVEERLVGERVHRD